MASVNDLGNGIGIFSSLGGVTGAGLVATTCGGGETFGVTTGAGAGVGAGAGFGATTGAGAGAGAGAGFGATTGAGAGAAAGFAGGDELGLAAAGAGVGGAAFGVVAAGCGLFSIACWAGFLGLKSQAKRLLRKQKRNKK